MIVAEVCANSIESVVEARLGGALRVELCDNLSEGGTTPSLSTIRESVQIADIQTNILIRPRGGNFVYSARELDIMQKDIHLCGTAGCNGVVLGILTQDGHVNHKQTQILVATAKEYGMSVTFHRAFDHCCNMYQALESIIDIGCDRILTSGGKRSAYDGRFVIKELVQKANGKIIILPGGGITENNIQELIKETQVREFHGSFSKLVCNDYYYNSEIGSSTFHQTDRERVRSAIANANSQ